MNNKELLAIKKSWKSRSDAENSKINCEWLKKQIVDFSTSSFTNYHCVFSHVPKSAGTSFDRFIAQFYELKDILHVNAADLNKLPQVVNLKNNFPKLISGHHPIHGLLYQLLPNEKIIHLSMMREPVSRVISYYNYISTREYHALHKQVKDLGFDKFIHQDLIEINNGQARRFSGTLHTNSLLSDNELYFQAKNIIDNCFTIVGVTEEINKFAQLISKKYKTKFSEVPKTNTSNVKIRLRDISSSQLKIIEQKNKVDIQLYKYVKHKFKQFL
jgi:hypothetical protein